MTAHLRQLRSQVEQLGKLAKDIGFSEHQHRSVDLIMKGIRKTLNWIEKPETQDKPKCPHCVD